MTSGQNVLPPDKKSHRQPEFLIVLPALGRRFLDILRQFAVLLLHDQVIKEWPLCLGMRLEY